MVSYFPTSKKLYTSKKHQRNKLQTIITPPSVETELGKRTRLSFNIPYGRPYQTPAQKIAAQTQSHAQDHINQCLSCRSIYLANDETGREEKDSNALDTRTFLHILYNRCDLLHSLVRTPLQNDEIPARLRIECRFIMFAWLCEAIHDLPYGYGFESFVLTVSYMRQLMHLKPDMKQTDYQKYMMACFVLATKLSYDNGASIPAIDSAVALCDYTYTKQQMKDAELEVVQILQYTLNHVTVSEIVHYLGKLIPDLNKKQYQSQSQTVVVLAMCIDLPDRYSVSTLAVHIALYVTRSDASHHNAVIAAACPDALLIPEIDFAVELTQFIGRSQGLTNAYASFAEIMYAPVRPRCKNAFVIDQHYAQSHLQLNKLVVI